MSEVPTFGQAVGGADGNFHVRGMQGSDNCCVPRTQRGASLHVPCNMDRAFRMVSASLLNLKDTRRVVVSLMREPAFVLQSGI